MTKNDHNLSNDRIKKLSNFKLKKRYSHSMQDNIESDD
jgi:hypothetical protein